MSEAIDTFEARDREAAEAINEERELIETLAECEDNPAAPIAQQLLEFADEHGGGS